MVGVVALRTVVGAFVIVADVGVCFVFLVAVVGGGSVVFLFTCLVGIGGLTIMCGFLLVVFVAVGGFLVVVGAVVVVGFLLITSSAVRKSHKKTYIFEDLY